MSSGLGYWTTKIDKILLTPSKKSNSSILIRHLANLNHRSLKNQKENIAAIILLSLPAKKLL